MIDGTITLASMKTLLLYGGAIAFLVLLFVAMGIADRRAARERREIVHAWARSRGHAFNPAVDYGFDSRHKEFATLRQGGSRNARNIVTLEIDTLNTRIPLRVGDYSYTVQAGRTSVTYYFSYVLATLPFQSIPYISVRRENAADRFQAAFGFEDIDFEDAEFSRAYHVYSKDKRFAYDLLDPRMIRFLKGIPVTPCIEIAGDKALISHVYTSPNTDLRWTPEQFDAQFVFTREFLSRIPEHLGQSLQISQNPKQ